MTDAEFSFHVLVAWRILWFCSILAGTLISRWYFNKRSATQSAPLPHTILFVILYYWLLLILNQQGLFPFLSLPPGFKPIYWSLQ